MERYQDIKDQEFKAKVQREKQSEEESRKRKIRNAEARAFAITFLHRIKARSILERYNREVWGSRGTIAPRNQEDTLVCHGNDVYHQALVRCLVLSFRHEETVMDRYRVVPDIIAYGTGESDIGYRHTTKTEVLSWKKQPVHPDFATQVNIAVEYEEGGKTTLSIGDKQGVSFASPKLSSDQNVYDAVIPRLVAHNYDHLAQELSSGYLSSGERIGGALTLVVGPTVLDIEFLHDFVAAAFLANALNRTRQK